SRRPLRRLRRGAPRDAQPRCHPLSRGEPRRQRVDRHASQPAPGALRRRPRADHERRGAGRAARQRRGRIRRHRGRIRGDPRAPGPQVRASSLAGRMSGPRVALVTGGGRGIGRATAVALARAGARVTVTARTRDEVAAVAEEIGGDFIAASAATAEGCAAIVEETRQRSGPIDILVCSAGLGAWGEKAIWDISHERWRETLAINLDGPFYLSKLVAGEMTQRGFGRIVFVSSTAGEVGGQEQPAYCASKHGVIGLMRAIAQDVIPFGVTCNAVLPGWVRTRMADDDVAQESRRTGRSPEEVWAAHAAEYAAGRVLDPTEVAAAIAFLCSEEASGVNGEALRVALGGLW